MNPLTGVLGEAWQIYRAHWRHLLLISFIFYVITAVVVSALGLLGSVGAVLGWLVQLVAMFLLQATLIKAVQDVRDGRVDLTVPDTIRSALPVLGRVTIASILAGIAITIGLILVIVPGLFLLTMWAVLIPVIVLERLPVTAAFGRSQNLVRGRGWYVFGTLVLVYLILLVVNILVSAVILSVLPVLVRSLAGTVIAGTLIAPFIAVVVTLIYLRLSGQDTPASSPYAPAEGYGEQGYGQQGHFFGWQQQGGDPEAQQPDGYANPDGYGHANGYGHPDGDHPADVPAGEQDGGPYAPAGQPREPGPAPDPAPAEPGEPGSPDGPTGR